MVLFGDSPKDFVEKKKQTTAGRLKQRAEFVKAEDALRTDGAAAIVKGEFLPQARFQEVTALRERDAQAEVQFAQAQADLDKSLSALLFKLTDGERDARKTTITKIVAEKLAIGRRIAALIGKINAELQAFGSRGTGLATYLRFHAECLPSGVLDLLPAVDGECVLDREAAAVAALARLTTDDDGNPLSRGAAARAWFNELTVDIGGTFVPPLEDSGA